MGKKQVLLVLVACLIAISASTTSLPAGANGRTVGLLLKEEGSFDGYALFGPMRFGTAYLIDNQGRLVQSWQTNGGGAAPYLLEDGSLIRSGLGGARWFTWEGTPIWDYDFVDGGRAHHDIEGGIQLQFF